MKLDECVSVKIGEQFLKCEGMKIYAIEGHNLNIYLHNQEMKNPFDFLLVCF